MRIPSFGEFWEERHPIELLQHCRTGALSIPFHDSAWGSSLFLGKTTWSHIGVGLEIHQAKQRKLPVWHPAGGGSCGDGAHRGSKDLALKPWFRMVGYGRFHYSSQHQVPLTVFS